MAANQASLEYKFKMKMVLDSEYLSDLLQSYKPIRKLLSNDIFMEPAIHL